ncbi:hypothetical protein BT93_F2027 [Corymbia citriodora subsp. variegata]|nr:hypothetical protein BT93_F2027 [Corymbia citriodora subsp. variegata]
MDWWGIPISFRFGLFRPPTTCFPRFGFFFFNILFFAGDYGIIFAYYYYDYIIRSIGHAQVGVECQLQIGGAVDRSAFALDRVVFGFSFLGIKGWKRGNRGSVCECWTRSSPLPRTRTGNCQGQLETRLVVLTIDRLRRPGHVMGTHKPGRLRSTSVFGSIVLI